MAHIVRSDPFFELISLQDQANQIFKQSPGEFKSFGFKHPPATANSLLLVNVFEDEHNITLQAEIPGMQREDLNIAVEGNVLTLTGERRVTKQEEKDNVHKTERRYGKFTRSFTLPPIVDCQTLFAVFKNGILNITLPKRDGIY